VVAEEVVEGVFLGHVYSQRSTASPNLLETSLVAPEFPDDLHAVKPNVKVLLDIAPIDSIYYRAPPGAVRRITMNLFSNTPNYTTTGQICLRLEAGEKPEVSSALSKQGARLGAKRQRDSF
jgi:hypothetical protein